MASDLPPPESWPYRPLFAKPDSHLCGGKLDVHGCNGNDGCPLGKVVDFESELFQGKILIRIRDLESSEDVANNKGYFEGRKRYNQFVIQGKFKEETCMRNVVFGGEYKKPFKLTPPVWFEKIMLMVFRKINPTLKMKMTGDKPYVLGMLVGGFQTVRADIPGQEPDIRSFHLEENNSAFGSGKMGEVKDFPMDSKSRRKFFGKVNKKTNEMMFKTDTVYTFEAFDDFINYKDYELKVAGRSVDMIRVMETPFFVMAKDVEKDKCLWCFELWHEKLL